MRDFHKRRERRGDRGGFGRRRRDNRGGFGRPMFREEKPVKEGEVYDVEINEVSDRGDGIAKIKNFVVFVPGTSKGDKVKIKITKVRMKFAEAEVVSGEEAATEEPAEEAVAEEPTEEEKEEAVDEETETFNEEETEETIAEEEVPEGDSED